MMGKFAAFGNPERFEVAVRCTDDSEPRMRRPLEHGWSMGDLRITVGGRVITRSRRGGGGQDHVAWYLYPFFTWLAETWAFLLHEEDFAWTEKSVAPAVVACRRALDYWIAASDEAGRLQYRKAQRWYRRHALRSASEGGLFPDLFIRRLVDEVELSWTSGAPLFAPDGFTFVSDPGFARLAVSEVGAPLWEALTWAASTPPPRLDDDDRQRHVLLAQQIHQVATLTPEDFESAYLSTELVPLMREAFEESDRADLVEEHIRSGQPFVDVFSPAVAMFGGVAPELRGADIASLRNILVATSNRRDSEELSRLVAGEEGEPTALRPHEDGYRLAEDLLEALDEPGDADFVDIYAICRRLEIEVSEQRLETDTIRGVALAGDKFAPTIVINTTSAFNTNANGRRFTIARELCHILYDRSRAHRVAHVSGPWVAPGIEKRANAFAAFLLMPRTLLLRHTNASADPDHIARVADLLQVNELPLIEHLYNIDLMSEWDRERLRAACRRH